MKKIIVDGVTYVPEQQERAGVEKDGMRYCVVRCDRSGVFAGFVKSHEGQQVVMANARRIWRWAGAASLSQLAVDGTASPEECKFPCEVHEIFLLDAIEIIPASVKAKKSIDSVEVWAC